ncbi:hypothetical protein, partial [Streptococcus infantarius]|uniref:hypothetical protein n=1 Tax=Streptococcus infantarius TaxID=102684 RepID=UPI0022E8D5B5
LFLRNFQALFKFVTAALSNNSYISLALPFTFVNNFFKFFVINLSLLKGSLSSSNYIIIYHLSFPMSIGKLKNPYSLSN